MGCHRVQQQAAGTPLFTMNVKANFPFIEIKARDGFLSISQSQSLVKTCPSISKLTSLDSRVFNGGAWPTLLSKTCSTSVNGSGQIALGELRRA